MCSCEQGHQFSLILGLAEATVYFSALYDAEHDLWNNYPQDCRRQVKDLNILGMRQVRGLLISSLETLPPSEFPALLKALETLLVRFQIVGRGRPGIIEKNIASLAVAVREGRRCSYIIEQLMALSTSDSDFARDIQKHVETRPKRVKYFLTKLEMQIRGHQELALLDFAEVTSPAYIYGEGELAEYAEAQSVSHSVNLLCNRCLIEDNLVVEARAIHCTDLWEFFEESHVYSTRTLADETGSPTEILTRRANQFASWAVNAWPLL